MTGDCHFIELKPLVNRMIKVDVGQKPAEIWNSIGELIASRMVEHRASWQCLIQEKMVKIA